MTHDDIADIVGPHRTLGAVIEVTSNMFNLGWSTDSRLLRNRGSHWAPTT
jgi:hypothetical protein